MEKKGWSRIINISGINGEKGQAGPTTYSAASPGCDTGRRGILSSEIDPGHDLPADIRQNSTEDALELG